MNLDYLQNLMKMDADGAGGASGEQPEQTEQMEAPEQQETLPKPEAKYTDEDIDRIVERKFARWQKAREAEIDQAKKLERMNAEEQAKYQKEEAEKAKAELARYKMADQARSMLAEKNLNVPSDLIDMMIGEDADITKNNIDKFAKLFGDAVNDEVSKRLKGKTPSIGAGNKTITREDIENIKDPVERQKLIAENLRLFE